MYIKYINIYSNISEENLIKSKILDININIIISISKIDKSKEVVYLYKVLVK